MFFVCSHCDLYSVTAVMYAIWCWIGPRHNGTQLYWAEAGVIKSMSPGNVSIFQYNANQLLNITTLFDRLPHITSGDTWWMRDITHDDVIKWKHFPRYWPFVRGIHRSPVNSPHKGQWRGALMFPLIRTRINGWVNNGEAGDMRRYRAHYDVTVILCFSKRSFFCNAIF